MPFWRLWAIKQKIIGKMLLCLKYSSLLGMDNIHMPWRVHKTVGKLPHCSKCYLQDRHCLPLIFVLILHKFKTHITLDYLPDSHTIVVDKSLFLSHYAQSLGEWFLMFLRIIVHHYQHCHHQGSKGDFLGLCTMEDEGATILQNESKPSSSDVASDPRRRQLKHSTVKISKLTW
jgi:hypothetical protein